MLNLQKVLKELKTDHMNLVIDSKLVAGATTATSNASYMSGMTRGVAGSSAGTRLD